MGPDQDANWCVTHPFFDHLMGTRKVWLGTAAQRADETRRLEHRSERATRPDVATGPARAPSGK
jgi:hypothetical protein